MCSWIVEDRVRIQDVNSCFSSELGQALPGPRVEHRIQMEIVPVLVEFNDYKPITNRVRALARMRVTFDAAISGLSRSRLHGT